MTLKSITLEGSAGTAVTTANSGASQISATPGTVTYDASMAENGTTGAKFTNGTGVVCIGRWLANNADTQMAFAGVVTTPNVAPASGIVTMGTLRWSGGVSLRFNYSNTNTITVTDAAGANTVTLLTVAQGSAINTRFRIEAVVTVGTGTGDGHYEISVYAANGGTTQLNHISSTTYNLGTNPIVGGDFGIINIVTPVYSVGWDDLQFNDGSSAEIGPYTPPSQAFASWTVTTNWATLGGGSVAANLSDNNDSTGITSLTNPTAQVLTGVLPALVKPAGDLVVPFRGYRSASTSGTITAKLYEGATLRATVTGIAIPTSVGAITVTFLAASLVPISVSAFAAGLIVTLEVTAA